jgi:DtxR family Mn-dependent transcriptional regulator
MTTTAVEDYLRTILELESENEAVSTTALATALGITSASVSSMIKKLARRGLLDHQPYRGATLTASGRGEALRVLRRHRLVEQFLLEVLEVPWERVHVEAHRIEHALSDYLVERIDDLLNHPSHDPHGAPIPTVDGRLEKRQLLRLADLAPGESGVVARVSDREPDLLRHLADLALFPGAEFTVTAIAPLDGPRTVQVGDSNHTLGREVAQRIMVSPRPEQPQDVLDQINHLSNDQQSI